MSPSDGGQTDPELLADEADDEFADIYGGSRPAKIMITTKVRPTAPTFEVLRELMDFFPNSFYYKRGARHGILFPAFKYCSIKLFGCAARDNLVFICRL